jgi:hypothetical protein
MDNQEPVENFQEAREAWACRNRAEQVPPPAEGPGQAAPLPGDGYEYYRIILRPNDDFETFRYQDIGRPGHIQRLSGKHLGGYWDDQAWLISKGDAHLAGDTLVADTTEARHVLEAFSPLVHVGGNIFKGRPRQDMAVK